MPSLIKASLQKAVNQALVKKPRCGKDSSREIPSAFQSN
jgi:hypothetical protein